MPDTDTDHFDADILRSAAAILQRRSQRPNGFILTVAVKTLRSIAADIDPGCPSHPLRNDDTVSNTSTGSRVEKPPD